MTTYFHRCDNCGAKIRSYPLPADGEEWDAWSIAVSAFDRAECPAHSLTPDQAAGTRDQDEGTSS